MRWTERHHPELLREGGAGQALPTSWGLSMDDAQRPSEREMRENSRSRSAILHVLRKRSAAVRVADLERVAYPLLGWSAPPESPEPPPVTFQYGEVTAKGGAARGMGRSGEGGDDGEAKKPKKEKKEKKQKSKWKEC